MLKESPAKLAPLNYLKVVIGYVVDLLYFGNPINFLSIVGSIIICLSTSNIILSTKKGGS